MLEQTSPDTWLVRRGLDSAPEATVTSFGGGYRLLRWSLLEAEQSPLGVYTSAELAETAWWRHVDGEVVDPRGGAADDVDEVD